MASIYKRQKGYVKKPNRNNFDLTFSNNFTTKIGQITPIMCKEVNPGDKFNINFAAGLRAMPLAFPIQTPLQAQFSFFYVRNRTLWKDWMDFYGRTKDGLIHPYISIPYSRAHEMGTCSLADYLGVPTTYAQQEIIDFESYFFHGDPQVRTSANSTTSVNVTTIPAEGDSYNNQGDNITVSDIGARVYPYRFVWNVVTTGTLGYKVNNYFGQDSYGLYIKVNGRQLKDRLKFPFGDASTIINNLSDCTILVSVNDDGSTGYENSVVRGRGKISSVTVTDGVLECEWSDPLKDLFATGNYSDAYITFVFLVNPWVAFSSSLFTGNQVSVNFQLVSTSDVSNTSNPFVIQSGDEVPDIRLNALPFRAYEAIYNSYYRNEINDPFVLNGTPEYNRYVTNLDGGADSITPLFLRMRNYELDFLTSAVPSPQHGIAPLVGVSSTGVFKFEDEDGHIFTLTPKIGDDGNTLTGIDSYDEGLPVGNIKRLTELIRYGISINDFRQVNSLQRFLETNIRRGLKYKQQILSHHGVNVRYDELDMPEYLGGLTRNINVTQITSTAETSEMALGEFGGQAGLFTQNTHGINHYFDEPGFLFCMLTIVPIPNYSQLLDKKFLKDNQLDYFFPEFNHIGYQPIDYREVTPIQAKLHGVDYNSVFGYQRPYYDLVSSVDEVHGLMRTTMQGFLLTRNFGTPPRLGHDFLEINPDDMTNPFVDTSVDSDTFVGQISFDIKAKRAVSKVAIPRLE